MLLSLNKKIMDDITLKEVEDYLISLISQMNVPQLRVNKRDWRWFSRNLYINNSDHELFDESVILLKKILSYNARKIRQLAS
tara:strand:- start:1025 stop:1270 length:246 start_codon:yes stop_codon:yes gene_type:complete